MNTLAVANNLNIDYFLHCAQVGAIYGGFKLGTNKAELPLSVNVQCVVPSAAFSAAFHRRVYLIYTGQQRLAKNTLINALRRSAQSPTSATARPREAEAEEMGKEENRVARLAWTEKSAATEELELKMKEVARQRGDMERRKLNGIGEMDQAQKACMLATFEKEQAAALDALDQDRHNQKNNQADHWRPGAHAVEPSEKLVMSPTAAECGVTSGGGASFNECVGTVNALVNNAQDGWDLLNDCADNSSAEVNADDQLDQLAQVLNRYKVCVAFCIFCMCNCTVRCIIVTIHCI